VILKLDIADRTFEVGECVDEKRGQEKRVPVSTRDTLRDLLFRKKLW
jgi:hypothetical protein